MRTRLPQTRRAIVHKFHVGAFKGYLTVGFNEAGEVQELFIKGNRSEFNGWTNTVGILVSIALQHGVPLEVVVAKLAYQHFEPRGVTQNKQIPIACSVVDYVARYLGHAFIKGYGGK